MKKGRIFTFLQSTDIPYIGILIVSCVLAYWPISFFIYSLKNDALNYFLPVRFQVSEAISNGHWPFWSPYFNLGYPLHGDMQSGVWNPIVQVISLFGPYTLGTLQFETLLYVFLSGLGMFYLVKHFQIDKKICLLVSVSYMLCGYNSDSAQFLNWISSASFLPFVILFFYRSLTENSWKPNIACGLFLYIFFVSAYPADFIILFYLLFIIFVWQTFSAKKFRSFQSFLPLVRKMSIISVVFLLLSAPAIISYFQFLSITERGTGANYEDAMSNPLHPALLFSYLSPLSVWKATFAGITDPLERNSYFGLTAFTFLLSGLLMRNKSSWLKFCIWAWIISLIFSLGEIGGIRPLTYYFLPLMDTFRHPANAKIFTIFFACIIAGFTIEEIALSSNRKLLRWCCFFIFGCFIVLLAISLMGNMHLFNYPILFTGSNFTNDVKKLLDTATFYDLTLANIILQMPFLLLLYFFAQNKINFKTLLVASLANSVLHTMLFMPFTVVKKDSVSEIQNILDSVKTKSVDMPDLHSSILENSIDGYKFFEEIGALNMYNKKIGRIDYRITPSNLNTQNIFWKKNTNLRNVLIQYPLLYKADTILMISDSSKVPGFRNKKMMLVNDPKIAGSNSFFASTYSAKFQKFTPNNWDIVISSDQPGVYCLFQNYYPNWKLFIDGKETDIIQCNISFMGFRIGQGTHTVSFRYHSTLLEIAIIINLLTLLIIILLGLNEIRKNKT